MVEILTWGTDIQAQFQRLGISPTCTYEGAGQVPSVYTMTAEEFSTLDADPEDHWEGVNAGWRYAEGSNLWSSASHSVKRVNANHRYLYGYVDRDSGWGSGPFGSLLEYMCDGLGASQPRNVAAVAVDLAKINGLTLGELFTRYQTKPWPLR